MAEYCGFPEDQFDLVFIILDKMDKIGWDGVKAELIEAGFSADSVAKYVDMLDVYKRQVWKSVGKRESCIGTMQSDALFVPESKNNGIFISF